MPRGSEGYRIRAPEWPKTDVLRRVSKRRLLPRTSGATHSRQVIAARSTTVFRCRAAND